MTMHSRGGLSGSLSNFPARFLDLKSIALMQVLSLEKLGDLSLKSFNCLTVKKKKAGRPTPQEACPVQKKTSDKHSQN